MAFTHLHLHTEYSLQDGMGKIPNIVNRVKELGMTACAITDHGVGYGLVEFYNTCKEAGIKPILGCEVYVAPGSRFDKSRSIGEKAYYHLILLVKNEQGYKNLCILISRSNTEGFYYRPRIDFELLKEHAEGLVCLSACVAGEAQRHIINGDTDKAKEVVLRYKNLFGDDYYLEIQNHGIREESLVAQEFVRISKELNVKLVCTNDCHYINSDDAEAHEWLLCLQQGKTLKHPDRMVYQGDYSIKSEEDMRKLFPALPEAFDNTMEIADKCNFDFVFGNYRMPKVVIPDEYGTDYFRYLSDEAWKGYEEKYPEGHPEREKAKENLTYELSVVKQMGFAEYFLDTRKTILYAKSNNIPVGPGRGSGAGSTMNYCLGITYIDPIKYNLLFERFLNPERVSMPDIDVDYDYAYKDEIVKSEADSNGWNCFAKIQTFGAMNAKMVIRDCARVYGLEASVGAALSKMIPDQLQMTLEKAWELNPDIKETIEGNEDYKKVWSIARKLEGLKKSASTHACGHIPTPVPCEQLFPVSVDHETGYLICQYNMTDAEHLGNLKKDLLMLRNLTIINVAQHLVKERYGVEIPLWTEEIINDKEALKMIASGETDGIFQLESQGMKNFMKELKPDCFEDIIAGVSLYRPGPMDFIPKYIEGKKNPASIIYKVPELKEILEPTYGVIVYQEQVMHIVRSLAGFSMGRADIVRKAMSKKRAAIMEEEGRRFIYGDEKLSIPGCVNRNIPEEIAKSIYDEMVDFAKYAFNKSHAACYAAISMQTAYLKCHYIKEFMAGLLSSVMDKTEKLVIYIANCKKNGVKILPPDINISEKNFIIEGESIRFGLLALKGVGQDVIEEIVKEREEHGRYTCFMDFVMRNPNLNKKVCEALIKTGALDFTGYSRRSLLLNEESLIQGIRKDKKNQVDGQLSLFDIMEEKTDVKINDSIRNVPEYSKMELLKQEKEISGIYISGHPMDEYIGFIKKNTDLSGEAFVPTVIETDGDMQETYPELTDGKKVSMAGIVTSIKKIFTKKDNRAMAFATMEDLDGSFECVIFPDTYEKYKNNLGEGKKLNIKGNISLNGDKPSVLISEVTNLEDITKKLWVQFTTTEEYERQKGRLVGIQKMYPGNDVLVVYIKEKGKEGLIRSSIKVSEDCFLAIKETYGEDNVRVTI